ncbi:MAG TPA: hypothetical protein PKC43_10315 [Phycisphaerales bacterium]|nr:hypothetical protein [Phycisphaerales bacterium]HMP37830.1 hypothetical protein [Phycisphaerales bacterium]
MRIQPTLDVHWLGTSAPPLLVLACIACFLLTLVAVINRLLKDEALRDRPEVHQRSATIEPGDSSHAWSVGSPGSSGAQVRRAEGEANSRKPAVLRCPHCGTVSEARGPTCVNCAAPWDDAFNGT